MKSLEELKQIRDRVKGSGGYPGTPPEKSVSLWEWLRAESPAAQSRFFPHWQTRCRDGYLKNVIVTQTGCIGLCQYEPIVEVYEPGRGKTTYIKMNAGKKSKGSCR